MKQKPLWPVLAGCLAAALVAPAPAVRADPATAARFDRETAYRTMEGGEGTTLIRGDFSGADGLDDIVVLDALSNSWWLHQGDGRDGGGIHDGTFTLRSSGPLGVNLVRSAAPGFLDGDALLDFAVVGYSPGSLSVMLNDGEGHFRTGQVIGFPPESGPVSVAVIGGGRPASAILVAMYGLGEVHHFVAAGSGRFEPHPVQPVIGVGLKPQFLLAEGFGPASGHPPPLDLNRDGRPDVVTVNYGDGSVSVLLGCGAAVPPPGCLPRNLAGTFSAPRHEVVSLPGGTVSTGGAGTGIRSAAAGDFNGDGADDLAIIEYSATGCTVHTLLGRGDGTFRPGPGSSVPTEMDSRAGIVPSGSGPFIAAGHFNTDGIPDLVFPIGGNGDFAIIMLGQGADGVPTGLFAPAAALVTSGPAWNVAASDVNGDGIWDIYLSLVSSPGAQLSVFVSR